MYADFSATLSARPMINHRAMEMSIAYPFQINNSLIEKSSEKTSKTNNNDTTMPMAETTFTTLARAFVALRVTFNTFAMIFLVFVMVNFTFLILYYPNYTTYQTKIQILANLRVDFCVFSKYTLFCVTVK